MGIVKSARPHAEQQENRGQKNGLNDRHLHDAGFPEQEASSRTPQKPRDRKTFSPKIYEARRMRAADLTEVHEEFKADKLHMFSPPRCAEHCEVDVSLYYEWMSGNKPMPAAADEWLPWPVVRRLREKADARRSKRGDL